MRGRSAQVGKRRKEKKKDIKRSLATDNNIPQMNTFEPFGKILLCLKTKL